MWTHSTCLSPKASAGCGTSGNDPCAQVLTPPEAAMLAGIIASPSAFSPRINPQAAMDRRNLVLKDMLDQGDISETEYNQGVAYLDDGTMVVVDNARRLIGKTTDIAVTSVLQTTAGKMIFGRFVQPSAVQSTAPAFVNANAGRAKGAAGALYVSVYYVGATFGSVLPGYAWQAWGWPGVAGTCLAALAVGLLADGLLCA